MYNNYNKNNIRERIYSLINNSKTKQAYSLGKSLHFSNNFLWNRNTDGSIFVKYENSTLKCFVSLYGLAPERKNLHYQLGLIN